MVGAPKASGGYSIASLPRTTGAETTKAPTTAAPTTGTAVENQKGGGRENNPVLRSLMTDGFEGHGAQGKGLALGHLKHADKKAGKAGKGGEAGAAGQPTGTPQDSLQKLVAELSKLLEQYQSQQPQPAGTPKNTGIVPPGAVQGPQPTPAITPYPI